MATVHIPALLRPLTGGASLVEAAGSTLRDVIADVVRQQPALAGRIADAHGILPEIMIAIGSLGSFLPTIETVTAPWGRVRNSPMVTPSFSLSCLSASASFSWTPFLMFASDGSLRSWANWVLPMPARISDALLIFTKRSVVSGRLFSGGAAATTYAT